MFLYVGGNIYGDNKSTTSFFFFSSIGYSIYYQFYSPDLFSKKKRQQNPVDNFNDNGYCSEYYYNLVIEIVLKSYGVLNIQR